VAWVVEREELAVEIPAPEERGGGESERHPHQHSERQSDTASIIGE